MLLLPSVGCWIVFTVPVYYIHPPVVSCKFWNGTQYQVQIFLADRNIFYAHV